MTIFEYTTTVVVVGKEENIADIYAAFHTPDENNTDNDTSLHYHFSYHQPIPNPLQLNLHNRHIIDDAEFIALTNKDIYNNICNSPDNIKINLNNAINEAHSTNDSSILGVLYTTLPQSCADYYIEKYNTLDWKQWCKQHWGPIHPANNVEILIHTDNILIFRMDTTELPAHQHFQHLDIINSSDIVCAAHTVHKYPNPHTTYDNGLFNCNHAYDPSHIFTYYLNTVTMAEPCPEGVNLPHTVKLSPISLLTTAYFPNQYAIDDMCDNNTFPGWNC